MFLVSRKETFEFYINNNKTEHIEKYTKSFFEQDFMPIINYISSKGLNIEIPSTIDYWDTNFIYKKLINVENNLGLAAKELSLFLYMRIDKKEPIHISQKGLFIVS